MLTGTTGETWRRSIRECRSIYSSMSDRQFVRWYCKRYNMKAESVCRALGIEANIKEPTKRNRSGYYG